MCCVCLPAVAKVLLSAPAPNSADIASWVPPTLSFFSSCFYTGRKKRAIIQIILFSLSSHMARAISFPFMPIKIAIFKRCWETSFFPWKGKTSRNLPRDLQYPLNSGQDLSSLWMWNLRPVLGILGTEEVKHIPSVSVTWETRLKFPMNNLFSLTTTDCQSIIYRTWSSVLSQDLSLSLYGLLQCYLP